MNEIRALVGVMEREENGLLQQRQATEQMYGLLLESGAALAFVLICASAAFGAMLTRRSFGEIDRTHRQLVESNDELLKQISRREAAESQLRQAQKMEAIGQLSAASPTTSTTCSASSRAASSSSSGASRPATSPSSASVNAALEAAKRSAALTRSGSWPSRGGSRSCRSRSTPTG